MICSNDLSNPLWVLLLRLGIGSSLFLPSFPSLLGVLFKWNLLRFHHFFNPLYPMMVLPMSKTWWILCWTWLNSIHFWSRSFTFFSIPGGICDLNAWHLFQSCSGERERERDYRSVTTLFFWYHSDKLKIGCLCQQLSHGSSWLSDGIIWRTSQAHTSGFCIGILGWCQIRHKLNEICNVEKFEQILLICLKVQKKNPSFSLTIVFQ